jgi:hypothetical protein
VYWIAAGFPGGTTDPARAALGSASTRAAARTGRPALSNFIVVVFR